MLDTDAAVRLDAPSLQRRLTLALGPPAGALLGANILWWAAARAHHFNYLSSRLWARWDSRLYLSIARHGYTLKSCGLAHSAYPASDWCGNSGWFPGYPALIWVLERLGLPGHDAGVAISSVFGFAMLAVLWNCFLIRRRDASSVLALALAAFFFGQVYQRAVFPISMELFFLLLVLWLAPRQRWLGAGLACAAAAFTYSTGFLIAPAVAAWVLWDRSVWPARAKAAAIALLCALTTVGFLAVLAIQRLATGVWGAFFLVQRKYGYHQLGFPVTKFAWTVDPLLRYGLGWNEVPSAQTLLVAAWCLCLVAAVVLHRRQLEAVDRLVLSATLWFWLFPLALGGHVHLYRSEALLLPSVLLARRLPLPVQALFLLIMVVLAYLMSVLFFQGTLV